MSMARAVALLLLVQGALSLQLMAPSRRMAPVAPMVARFAPVSMQQDGAREREKKTGRQATIARPKPKPKEKSKEEVDKEGEWKVLLHNDDVSLALTRSALLPAVQQHEQPGHCIPSLTPPRRCAGAHLRLREHGHLPNGSRPC